MIAKSIRRKRAKRLVIEISDEDHAVIKDHAEMYNMSMRLWILRAIIERLQKEGNQLTTEAL